MSRAEDDFLAGQGALAGLLRAVPAFEPPAHMTAWMAQQAAQAQAQIKEQTRKRTSEQALQTARTAAAEVPAASSGLSFEPPPGLQAFVLAEAARIQAAQQPRRDAVLQALQQGQPAREVLGHDVSDEAAQWLARQPVAQPAAPAAVPPVATAPARTGDAQARAPWWRALQALNWQQWMPRVATLGVAVLVWGMWAHQSPWQASAPSATSVDAPVAETVAAAPAPVEALPAPAAQAHEDHAAPAALARKRESMAPAVPSTPGGRSDPPVPAAAPAPMPAPAAPAVVAAAPAAAPAPLAAPSAGPVVPVTDGAELADAAAKPRAPAVAKAAPWAESAAERRAGVVDTAVVARAAPAAPAPAAAPAPSVAALPALTVSLQEAPAAAAQRWLAQQAPGAGQVGRVVVRARHAESADVQAWARALAQALSARSPGVRWQIEADATLAEGVVRIQAGEGERAAP